MMNKIFVKLNRIRFGLINYVKGGIAYAKAIGVDIGNDCRIYTNNFGSEPFLITIGNHVTITSGVRFITHDGSGWLMRDQKGRRYSYQRIKIGDYVFIGVNSIIMPGVFIEDKVIIAPGTVVTKSIKSGSVVAGVPARVIGKYTDIEKKMLENYISDFELDKTVQYKDRILKIVSDQFKPYL